ncbi:MAG: hypothetical protein JNK15_03540 [Planctomycetes bacterium]|nr:hypothetical protein [Planctomycetota bacterium]
MNSRNDCPHPLLPDELNFVEQMVAAIAANGDAAAVATIAAVRQQQQSLSLFAELLGRYPSPLQEQVLDGRRRDLDTLVDAMVQTDQASFPFRAPTQALVGRAMNMAQINFLRMLWHLAGGLPASERGRALREQAAVRLRASVHCRLVEEVLADIVTDAQVERELRARAVRKLAALWGNRLTWRVNTFFPILAATWEARQRVRVVGGTLGGTAELMDLLRQGGEPEFVDLLLDQDYGEVEVAAFHEFLFGTSSEELDRLAQRMAREGLSSIELDSRRDDASRDAGSLLFEFFRSRLVQCGARRATGLPGPRHTAEGYVMLAWLARQGIAG